MTSGQHLASDEPGKRLLALGNEAFARGAIEAGVQLDAPMAATRAGNPYILDVAIRQVGGGAGSTWYQKFSLADTRTRKV